MATTIAASAWPYVALAGFILILGFSIWLGLRQQRELHSWIDDKVKREGWTRGPDLAAADPSRWIWLESVGSSRDVHFDRLATNPGSGPTEAAFSLSTRSYGGRAGARRIVGSGIVARLPRAIAPRIVALPPTAGVPFFEWYLGFKLPEVALGDAQLAQSWQISSPEPDAAAAMLAADAGLRAGLVAVAEEGLRGSRPKFLLLIVEMHGDRAALMGGPKLVGRQPFADLEEVAALLTARMGAS